MRSGGRRDVSLHMETWRRQDTSPANAGVCIYVRVGDSVLYVNKMLRLTLPYVSFSRVERKEWSRLRTKGAETLDLEMCVCVCMVRFM